MMAGGARPREATFQLGSHLPSTPGRMIGMQVINDRFAFQLGVRNRFAIILSTIKHS